MPTAKKVAAVAELEDLISRSRIAIATDYRGVSVADLAGLRRHLRASGIELKVAKNTLANLAATRVGKPELADVLKGPTALAFGFADEAEPAKVLMEYLRTSRLAMSVTGALLGNRPMTAEEVTTLSTLPSKNVLLAQMLGSMQSPIAGLVSVLSATIGSLAWALQARIRQMEEEQAAA